MCRMQPSHATALETFRRHNGVLRMADALRAGVSRRTLYAMRDEGLIEPLSRGVYRLSSLPDLSAPDLVAVSQRAPEGVICLLSALEHHGLTGHVTHAVDLAVERGTQRPRIDYPPTRVYLFSGEAFLSGIRTFDIDGFQVRIYCAEKSIADAFKFRNRIGTDVALQALRNWRERPKPDISGLLRYARICRVENVVRPYLEAML
ncbi:MAG: type IV toxin-antitoxin system AbiEi family antitoxin domain-containing protein [Pseudomonadota bacterium]|nr:type IV toxin-antitoxin system AbiEi family antitoxin domain-containing protein [Pseudomonadota bacterium]